MPAARVFCPCKETLPTSDEIPGSIFDKDSTYQLEWLYLCDFCQAIRCPKCVDHEVVTRFCPSCMHEVPSTVARKSNNTCPRNCLQCPLCMSPVLGTGSQGIYSCTYCEWKLDPSLLQLNRATNKTLSDQVRESRDNQTQERFRALEKNYRSQIFENIKEGTGSYSEGNSDRKLPCLVQLRAKIARKCTICRHTLCKPETNILSTGFKFQSMATAVLPKLILTKHPEEPSHLLTVFNALSDTEIKVNIAVPAKSSSEVTMLCPNLNLGPCPEELNSKSLISQVPSFMIQTETNASRKVFMEGIRKQSKGKNGIYESGPNWSSFIVVTDAGDGPKSPLPLFISISFQAEMQDDNSQEPSQRAKESVELGYWCLVNFD